MEYSIIKCDGGTLPPNFTSSYSGGGLGNYTDGKGSGKRSPNDKRIEEILNRFKDGKQSLGDEQALRELLDNMSPMRTSGLPDGGVSRGPSLSGGYHGGGFGSYSSSSGGEPICCIGIIVLIVLGLILNFIFHLEIWLIVVILVVVFIVGIIVLKILE